MFLGHLCDAGRLVSFAMAILPGAVIACGGEEAGDSRAPAPDEAAQKAAMEVVAEVYKEPWRTARTPAEKTAFALKMIDQAERTEGDLPGKFVLLRLARDVAAQAGDVATTFRAIEGLAGGFQIDAVAMKTETLLSMGDGGFAPELCPVVLEQCFRLLRAAISKDDYGAARRLVRVGQGAARRLRDAEAVRYWTQFASTVDKIAEAHVAAEPARMVLEKKPADPEANLAVGRFLCLGKGDWERGLPMLALGGDAALRDLAVMELKSEETPESRLALGDAWWDLAEKAEGREKDLMTLRAATWYARTLPDLGDALARAKALKRLDAVAPSPDVVLLGPEVKVEPGAALPPGLWVDVTDWIDPKADRVLGSWSRQPGGLVGGPGQAERFMLPVRVAGDYQLEVEFTRLRDVNMIAIVLPVGSRRCQMSFSTFGGKASGLELIDGRGARDHPLGIRPGNLVNGRRYVTRLEVQAQGPSASVEVRLDGKPFTRWSGKIDSLAVVSGWEVPDGRRPAVGVWGCVASVHRVRVRVLSGQATRVAR